MGGGQDTRVLIRCFGGIGTILVALFARPESPETFFQLFAGFEPLYLCYIVDESMLGFRAQCSTQ